MNSLTIVFFDGVCGLCNWTVDILLPLDRGQRLRFAPLQGKTAERLLTPADRENLESFILWKEGHKLYRSEAVLQALREIGGLWCLLASLLRPIPRSWRDFIYNWIAVNRYHWFGKKDSCRLPTPEERSRFLD